MKKTRIKEVVVAVTYKCNSRCRMCNIWKIKEHFGEIKPQDFLHLPKNLKDINISGGEPFLREDLSEIVDVMKNRCAKANIVISSNGFATDLIVSRMRKIVKIMPNIGVAISIDGIGEAHSKIRGIENGFEKAIDTIVNLKKVGVKNIKIGFTIGEYNSEELLEVYYLAKKLGTELSLTVVHSSENYFGKDNAIKDKTGIIQALNWLIDKELSTWNYKNWGRAYFAYGAREFIQKEIRVLPDYSGILNIFINPQGVIYPCDVSSKRIGDLKNIDNIESETKTDLTGCEKSWMVCTARQSIKKHYVRVIIWIIWHKFLGFKI
ncbi:MAG: Radical SAM domain protein [Candidatus Moranbacteria bacterium GW2011_GWE1_35_17]|nr:MAG: Radical SAM domain protein [Candidatus Moranbacteria bacterium GW2011_GWE1_35_17]KKP82799.1 MAG: Radical SAM domain protein [Candidatus Moranbacteria bacterium GW2011_GWF1_35_5]KKP82808.1 MAG: Radical SAM domain protein [Candidatus Moranbacteria bacterium GW2011_GWF2_35_54]